MQRLIKTAPSVIGALCLLGGMLGVPLTLYAQSNGNGQAIGQLEQSVYGQSYPHMPEEDRLGRLENTLFYGGRQLKKRWIDTVQLPAPIAGLIAPNRSEPFPSSQRIEALQQAVSKNSPRSQSLPNHSPLQMLDYLEHRLFSTAYPQQPVTQRLERLEDAVFGQQPIPSKKTALGSAQPFWQLRKPGMSRLPEKAAEKPDLAPVVFMADVPPKAPHLIPPPHLAENNKLSANKTTLPEEAAAVQQRLQRLLYAVPLAPRAVKLHQ